MKRLLFALFLLSGALLAAGPKAKNVILFLTDGGGLATVSAASIHGYGRPQALYIQNMPHIGLSDTSSASNWVTDSANGMTAIVTGVKTHNGVISQGPDAVRGVKDGTPLKTILEYAEERGLSTGVMTDVEIGDATPAACYAHHNDRGKMGEIFLQLTKPRFGDGPEIVIGRGRDGLARGTQAPGVDLWAALRKAGYTLLETPDAIKSADTAAPKLAGVFKDKFDVTEAVDLAINRLSRNRKGFFLMVECDVHLGDARKSVEAMVAADRLVRHTAEKMKGTDTLIISTSDHSYDLRLPGGVKKGEDIIPHMKLEGHHDGEEVVVAAQGPGSELVHGFLPNTRIFEIMMAAYGWKADARR